MKIRYYKCKWGWERAKIKTACGTITLMRLQKNVRDKLLGANNAN